MATMRVGRISGIGTLTLVINGLRIKSQFGY